MKEKDFTIKNQHTWKQLEMYITRFSKSKLKGITSNEIEEFLDLFRSSSHHLSYIRTHYPGSQLEKYLNALVGNAHHHLYTSNKNPLYAFKNFIYLVFPNRFQQYQLFVLSSFLVFLFSTLLSFYLVINDISYSLFFLPESIIDAIDYNFEPKEWDYALMSSIIMINNITVSLKAFVYGIFLGIGTFYILFINGGILGALTALVYLNGDLVKYASLILPHGILELTAIFIAGAAGLLLGRGILLPGKYKRLDYIIRSAKEGVILILGSSIFLIIAAIIEGFFTPLPIDPFIKLFFALLTFIAIIIYLLPLRS